MKNVAIVGTQGVPARYGGFETLVENIIGKNCPLEVQYTVFCSSKDFKKEERLLSYKGAFLKYVPLHANGFQSTPYDIWSLLKVKRGYDVIVILGVSRSIFLPVFLMGMCVAKYDLFNRWFKIWNAGMKHVFKFLLELLAVFILYKAYRTLPLTVYSEIHWGVYPIVFMAFCCEFINVIPGVRQILLFLGKHSMNIFLIHTFIRKSSFVYVSGYFLTNTLTLLLASLAVSIALEWLKKVTGYNRLIQNICMKIG